MCFACHTVCVQWTLVKRVYVKLETVGRYCTEDMYCSTSCTQYGMRNLAFFRGAFFAVTTISRLPFVTWGTAATPAQNFSVTPSTAPVFSLTQSRVNDMTHRCVSGDDDVVHGIGLG